MWIGNMNMACANAHGICCQGLHRGKTKLMSFYFTLWFCSSQRKKRKAKLKASAFVLFLLQFGSQFVKLVELSV